MATNKTDIYVFAQWFGVNEPELLGILSAHQAKGRKAFSFEYDNELAISVGEYFRLTTLQMNQIIEEVKQSVKEWQNIAKTIGISRAEQELMSSAFRI